MRWITLALAASGCTTLGPMPMTTGVSAIPAGRPGAEVQVASMPAFHLSSSVSKPAGSSTPQVAALVEPDRLLGRVGRGVLQGVFAGARVFGASGDTPTEPMIGFRRALDEDFAIAVIAYGTSTRSSDKGASYHAFRAGGEAAADGRIAALTRWLSLHGQASASLTRIVASGRYCVDMAGLGIDCNADDPSQDVMLNGRLRGWYPSATAAVSLDVGRTGRGVLHSARLAFMTSAGQMPRVVDGEQTDGTTIFAFGASLTLGIGAP